MTARTVIAAAVYAVVATPVLLAAGIAIAAHTGWLTITRED